MKNSIVCVLFFVVSIAFNSANAQEKQTSAGDTSKIFIVEKNDGAEYIGKIILQDEREVLVETKKLGRIYIPRHEIKSIKEIENVKLSKDGDVILDEVFASRYFIATNGLPSKKGDSYIQWNLYGPDFQFGVAENLNLGIMTTWFGVPIIGSARYSIPLGDNLNLGVGSLLGTGSWAQLDWGLALPFACITIGSKKSNITLTGGYGLSFSKDNSDGQLLLSIAGITKLGEKISLVFDSFIVPNIGTDNNNFSILIPGIRWQADNKRAFQFGFAGLMMNGELAPFPLPMIQWYRKL